MDILFEKTIKHCLRGKIGQLLDRIQRTKLVYVIQGKKLNVCKETEGEVKLHAKVKSIYSVNCATCTDNSYEQ